MIRSIVLLVACLSVAAPSMSQTLQDSVQRLMREKTGIELYYALHDMVVEYGNKNDPRALEVSELAEWQATAVGDSLCIVKSQRVKGQILVRLGRLQEAVDVLKPVSGYIGDHRERLYIMNSLGVGYLYLGKVDLALKQFTELEQFSRKIQDSVYLAVGLSNLGMTYYKLKDYRKALPFYLESYDILKGIGRLDDSVPMNMSLCYSALNDYENARKLLKESVAICGDGCPPVSALHIDYALGRIFMGEKKVDSAEICFWRSLQQARITNNLRLQLDNIYWLADLHIDNRSFSAAEKLLMDAEAIVADGIPFNIEKIKVYSRLADLYSSFGDFEKASHYQAKYIVLRDSIYDESLTANLMKVESEYLQRLNLQRLADQEEIIALKERVIHHQKVLNIILSVFGLTVLIFAIFFYKNYILKRNMNVVLQRKVRERTQQLESHQYALLKTVEEKDFLIARFQRLFSEVSCTVEGLCSTAVQGAMDPSVRGHMRGVQRTLNDFTSKYGGNSGYHSNAPTNGR